MMTSRRAAHFFDSVRASAQELELNRYLWLLLVVTNLVDVLASRRAFQFGVDELNPIVDGMLSQYGILGVAVFKTFWLAVLLALLPFVHGWSQKFLAVACSAYLVLTVLHIWFLSPLL